MTCPHPNKFLLPQRYGSIGYFPFPAFPAGLLSLWAGLLWPWAGAGTAAGSFELLAWAFTCSFDS